MIPSYVAQVSCTDAGAATRGVAQVEPGMLTSCCAVASHFGLTVITGHFIAHSVHTSGYPQIVLGVTTLISAADSPNRGELHNAHYRACYRGLYYAKPL